MKKIYVICAFALFLLFGCSENERMTWEAKPGVYLSEYTVESDSLLYSFRISGKDVDTIYVRVKLQGAILDSPKEFQVFIDTATTAVEGLHYNKLENSYIFPVDNSEMTFPIIIQKQGTELDDKIVSLCLRLQRTDDLDLALLDQSSMRLLFTNKLIKPYYWDMPLSLYFGVYSQAKHLKTIELIGHDFPLKDNDLGVLGYPYWMRAGRKLAYYYSTHTEYDENNNLITPWEPF